MENAFIRYTGELGYDGPLYDGFLHMTDDMLGPSPMHIKYSSYVYDGYCIWRTNFPGPIESVISKFTCSSVLMNISSSNLFPTMLSAIKFHWNCQAANSLTHCWLTAPHWLWLVPTVAIYCWALILNTLMLRSSCRNCLLDTKCF